MPSISITYPQGLQVAGASLEVELGVPSAAVAALRKAGMPIPSLRKGVALIDTGGSDNYIHPGLPAQLGLQKTHPSRHVRAMGGSTIACPEYWIQVVFPGVGIVLEMEVLEVHLMPGLDFIIGRKGLEEAVFIYNGPLKTFTIAY
jgi:hypothetical protein